MSASPANAGAQATAASPGLITTRPLLGVFGVLLGALVGTCTGRLLSVGLVDLRGALHLGVDEASWIGTSFNAALMFIGPFSVYLGGLLGARRVLLACAALFTVISLLLPFASSLPVMLILLVLAGLTAGTFYPLTLSFVLRNLPMRYVLLGIAMYAMDIVFTTNVATSLEAWYMDHLSWHWIFWNSAVLTPIMMVLIYFGIPWQPLPKPKEGQPKPNWRGFLYASLGFALLYMALDQGQRLDWMNSGTIVALTVSGLFLLLMTVVRRIMMPNPLVNFKFLLQRNMLLLGRGPDLLSFHHARDRGHDSKLSRLHQGLPSTADRASDALGWAATVHLRPACDVSAEIYRCAVDHDCRLWLVAVACLMNAHLSSAWSGANFLRSQAVMAIGLAFAFNSMVGVDHAAKLSIPGRSPGLSTCLPSRATSRRFASSAENWRAHSCSTSLARGNSFTRIFWVCTCSSACWPPTNVYWA